MEGPVPKRPRSRQRPSTRPLRVAVPLPLQGRSEYTLLMNAISSAAPAIAMLAAFACAIGGGWMIRTRRDPKRGWLLVVMALVLLGNVLIWTL